MNKTIEAIKAWAAPALGFLAWSLVWSDISEMKADVKLLLTNGAVDRTEIQALKSDVAQLKQAVFYSPSQARRTSYPSKLFAIKNEAVVEVKSE